MQIRALSQRPESGNPFRQRIDRLICAVGTREFEGSLFRAAREATGCEHLTAFAISERGDPGMILAANEGPFPVARLAGDAYVSRFWKLDPINQFYSHHAVAATGLMTRINREEIRELAFRRNCYQHATWPQTGAQIIERVSVFKALDGVTFKISFHRAQSAGSFGAGDIENIADATNVITALIARHAASAPRTVSRNSRSAYFDALVASAPQLTEREASVCSGIVLGMTSDGIALDLGISVNTVRTYRKRAYARLKISSENELIKLVLT